MPMPDLNQTHGSGGTEEQGPHQMKNLVCFVSLQGYWPREFEFAEAPAPRR